ncbi:MAG: radical SAM protein [Proteobacteria bacterium]|nr:radical SAM protein [Pseudomonadota bacterium]MBU4298127.1 radical SAM protein [Pseudomonadota bacterium]MCG2747935.1 radical SAM protein [Desulfobulbaceae bacterium]
MTKNKKTAGYLTLHQAGELSKRVEQLTAILAECTLCPRRCKVNRTSGEKGFCRTGKNAVVASYCAHFGEESCLVGVSGSGTIFFANCNLGCVFCQNYSISHQGEGIEVDSGQLAAIMLSLQKQGCHNINLVTPSHVAPQIAAALPTAIAKGLALPLVYNSSGYDSVDTLRLLDGMVDIYMPDFKFWSSKSAKRFANAPDYPDMTQQAISEMHRQVGDLQIDDQGIAVKGLLVRHLVMPGGLAETEEIMNFLAKLSDRTYVNVMEQYRPLYKATKYPPIDQPLSHEEYEQAVNLARQAGLKRLEQNGLLYLLKKMMHR